MGSYRITRRVEAAPEQVYRAFTDPVLIADWMDASAVLDASGPLDVSGTRFTLVIRGPHRFRSEVVRAEPGHVHETTGRGPFGSYRMVATLARSNGATQLDLLTEYSLPFRAIGRWVDRRWIDREPRTIANREVDRLVSLVSEPSSVDAEDAREGPRGQPDLDALVARAQTAHLDRELDGWSTRSVTWSGGETQVIEAGSGEPLLLVHGGMGNAADWASLMNRLATSRRVIAVDRPGHGLATPFDYRGVDLWRHAGGFLREVLDGLGLETVDVAGNSMGGMWSIALAEAHPERVRHLILIGAPAGSKRSIPMKVGVLAWPVAGLLIAKMIRRGTIDSTRSFWRGLIVARDKQVSSEILEFATVAAKRNVDVWLSLIRNFAWVGGARRGSLIANHLRGIRVPVSFVWGDRDAFDAPERAQELAAVHGSSQVTIVPGAGHLPWLDEPDMVASAVLLALAGQDRHLAPEPTMSELVAV